MRTKVVQLIAKALEDMGEDYPAIELSEPPEKTPLFGQRGWLDSLGIVNLIVDVEGKVSEDFGVDIVLADERAMSRKASPFLSVGSLARYIEKLLREQSGE